MQLSGFLLGAFFCKGPTGTMREEQSICQPFHLLPRIVFPANAGLGGPPAALSGS
jgi:hypothetical protein